MYPVPCNLTKSYYPVCCCLQAPRPFYPRDRNEHKNGRVLYLLLELKYMLQRKLHNSVQEIMLSIAQNLCCKCKCIEKSLFTSSFLISFRLHLCASIIYASLNQSINIYIYIYIYIGVSIYLNVCLQYSVDSPWQVL